MAKDIPPSEAQVPSRTSELIAHVLEGHEVNIRPAPMERDWMDASTDRFAYRCLPLNIANAHGWEICTPLGFSAVWNGGPGKNDILVVPDTGSAAPAISHFGGGVLTFHVPCLFQTSPGFDLYVTGPVNRPKDAIQPLTGVVETDWSPYTFTMNWMFTRARTKIRFEPGEPFCHLFPVGRSSLETIIPRVQPIERTPDLKAPYGQWSESRDRFTQHLEAADPAKTKGLWQKTYFRGQTPNGAPAPTPGHRVRLRLNPFEPS